MRKTDVRIVYLPNQEAYERMKFRNELDADTLYIVGGDNDMLQEAYEKADEAIDIAGVAIQVGQTAQRWVAEKYSLPEGGIPEADLDADVRQKLNSGGGGVTPEQLAAAIEAYMAEHPITEADPTVPDWAKAASKPRYTAAEVGAVTSGQMTAAINTAVSEAIATVDSIADEISSIIADMQEAI